MGVAALQLTQCLLTFTPPRLATLADPPRPGEGGTGVRGTIICDSPACRVAKMPLRERNSMTSRPTWSIRNTAIAVAKCLVTVTVHSIQSACGGDRLSALSP